MDSQTRAKVEALLSQLLDTKELDQAEFTFVVPTGYTSTLFPLQKQIVNDPAKRIALLAGRRASKSYILAYLLHKTALENANTVNLYLCASREDAKRIMWPVLLDHTERFSISCTVNHVDLTLVYPNNSRVILRGLPDRRTADSLRGPKYKLVCIDEAAHIGPHLRYAVEEVLDAPLEDLEGTLILASTPNRTSTGYFHEATTDPDSLWKLYHWTVLDNPEFPLWAGMRDWQDRARWWIEAKRKAEGWDEDNPIYQREWMAAWVRDDDIAVISFDNARNTYTELPNDTYRCVLGLDTGFKHNTALTALYYNSYDECIYIEDHYEAPFLSYDECVRLVQDYKVKHKANAVVADPNPDTRLLEDLKRRYGLPIVIAKKRDKAEHLELLNTAFKSGRIKINRSLKPLIENLQVLTYTDKDRTSIVGGPDDCLHSMLYGFTHIIGSSGKLTKKPEPEDKWERWEKESLEKLDREMRQEQRNKDRFLGRKPFSLR